MKQQSIIIAFKKAAYEPKTNLAENIWRAITVREKNITLLKLWTFSLMGVASLAGIILAFKILLSDFAQSGFYEYLSLLFSNIGDLASSWKELFLSLAESLPLMSIALTFALVFIFFLSLRFVMKQIIKVQFKLSF